MPVGGFTEHPSVHEFDAVRRLLEIIRERSGDGYFIMMHGDSTFSTPDGEHMVDFSVRMYEAPESIIEESKRHTERLLEFAGKLRHTGLLDGFALCTVKNNWH